MRVEIENCIESESNVLINANNCNEYSANYENNQNIINNLTEENWIESQSDVLNNASDYNENKSNYENVDDNVTVLETRSGRKVKKPKKFL